MGKALIHLHSSFSFDSISKIEDIVNFCLKLNINLLAITDHDTIEGSIYAEKYINEKYKGKLKVIIGAEYLSNLGDLLIFNIRDQLNIFDAYDLIDEAKRKGGLVFLPHPYYAHKEVEKLALKCDAIEIFNSRCTEAQNNLAVKLSLEIDKPTYGSSDAHFVSELENVVNYYSIETDNLLDIINNSHLKDPRYTKTYLVMLSQFIKFYKRKDFYQATIYLFRTFRYYLNGKITK